MRRSYCLSAIPFVGADACGLDSDVEVGGVRLRPRQIVAGPEARIGDVSFAPGVYSPGEIVDRVNRESGEAFADVGPDGQVLVNELPAQFKRRRRPRFVRARRG